MTDVLARYMEIVVLPTTVLEEMHENRAAGVEGPRATLRKQLAESEWDFVVGESFWHVFLPARVS